MDARSRKPALDVLRCVALLCVAGTHFFLNSGFYRQNVSGFSMYAMIVVRGFCMICVPLFLMLSGYLSGSKTPSRSYYRKLGKILAVYLMASLFCGVCRVAYDRLLGDGSVSVFGQIAGIFSFSTAPYAWYMEMYLGLFFLIPFLNCLYHALPSQAWKRGLVLTLAALTALPSIANVYCLSDAGWWLRPSSATNYHALVPAWWTDLYPVTYYFIGMYLRQYPLKYKRWVQALLTLLVGLLTGAYCYWRSYGSHFIKGIWQSYGSAGNLLLAVLVFSLLSGLKLEFLGARSRKWLARLSDWCLGAYLVSWVFDTLFYQLLNSWQSTLWGRFLCMGLVIGAVCLCSLAVSAVINGIYSLLARPRKKAGSHGTPV